MQNDDGGPHCVLLLLDLLDLGLLLLLLAQLSQNEVVYLLILLGGLAHNLGGSVHTLHTLLQLQLAGVQSIS